MLLALAILGLILLCLLVGFMLGYDSGLKDRLGVVDRNDYY